MSCSMTIDAVRDRSKTVTRRHVDMWKSLERGDRLTLIEKGMGQVVLAEVEVVDVSVEPLSLVTPAECAAEGFPTYTPFEFQAFWMYGHGYGLPEDEAAVNRVRCRRIEWRYLDDPPTHRPDYIHLVSEGGAHSLHGPTRAAPTVFVLRNDTAIPSDLIHLDIRSDISAVNVDDAFPDSCSIAFSSSGVDVLVTFPGDLASVLELLADAVGVR